MSTKPLGRKAYGSIAHLPNSRIGPGDHHVSEGQARICMHRIRDAKDIVYIQEKVDGSCCAVAKVNGEIIPLGRAGWPAITSPYKQHHLFHAWVLERWHVFNAVLDEGERIVGEWLAQAHGTRYDLAGAGRQPWQPFDIMRDETRMPMLDMLARIHERDEGALDTTIARFWLSGPVSPENATSKFQLANRLHAIDSVEGVVYRVEREGKVDFLAKWVRPDKIDGKYLSEVSGLPAVWNFDNPPANGHKQATLLEV